MNDGPLYTHAAPLGVAAFADMLRLISYQAGAFGEALCEMATASTRCATSFRTFARRARLAGFGRRPRGWRKHVRRMKAEGRRDRG